MLFSIAAAPWWFFKLFCIALGRVQWKSVYTMTIWQKWSEVQSKEYDKWFSTVTIKTNQPPLHTGPCVSTYCSVHTNEYMAVNNSSENRWGNALRTYGSDPFKSVDHLPRNPTFKRTQERFVGGFKRSEQRWSPYMSEDELNPEHLEDRNCVFEFSPSSSFFHLFLLPLQRKHMVTPWALVEQITHNGKKKWKLFIFQSVKNYFEDFKNFLFYNSVKGKVGGFNQGWKTRVGGNWTHHWARLPDLPLASLVSS